MKEKVNLDWPNRWEDVMVVIRPSGKDDTKNMQRALNAAALINTTVYMTGPTQVSGSLSYQAPPPKPLNVEKG